MNPSPRAIMVLECHPDETSLCKSLANAICDGLGEHKSLLLRHDLGAMDFKPELTASDLKRGSSLDAQVMAMEQELKTCRHLVMVFPLWWGTMPALLTGWVQRVFSAETAYTVEEVEPGLTRVRGLLTGLHVHLVLTADRAEPANSGLKLTWEEDICNFTGAHLTNFIWIGPVRTSSAACRKGWIEAARRLALSLCDPAAL